jgi:hypothetical protein
MSDFKQRHELCNRAQVMRMIRRGHCLRYKPRITDEIRFIKTLCNIFPVGA